MQYNNEMRGVLFTNERRDKPSSPHFKGEVTIEGKAYWLSGWFKQDNENIISLSVQEKKPRDNPPQQRSAPVQQQSPMNYTNDLDDGPPF